MSRQHHYARLSQWASARLYAAAQLAADRTPPELERDGDPVTEAILEALDERSNGGSVARVSDALARALLWLVEEERAAAPPPPQTPAIYGPDHQLASLAGGESGSLEESAAALLRGSS